MKLILFVFLKLITNLLSIVYSQQTIGYVYIDANVSRTVVLAQPSTISNLQNFTLTIKTTLIPLDDDIVFMWTIRPIKSDRFYNFDGIETISKNQQSTSLTITVKDNNIPELEDQNYLFKIDKVLLKNNSISSIYMTNNSQSSVVIHVLPSNYPFGRFEFSNNTPSTLKISKYSPTSTTHSVSIKRYFGTAFRVLVNCELIEINNNSSTNTTKSSIYVEFLENEAEKILILNYLANDTLNSVISYPRTFVAKINDVKLLDGIPFSNETSQYISQSADILPSIGNFSSFRTIVVDDKCIIEFSKDSFHVYLKASLNTFEYANLVVSRTVKNDLYPDTTIEFVTYPLYGLRNMTSNPSAAFGYIDYTPVNGQAKFDADSSNLNITFQIKKNLESGMNPVDRSFEVVLVNIKNCDSCIIGLNKTAIVYITYDKKPFNDLIQTNNTSSYLLLNTTSKAMPQTICFQKKANRSIIVKYKINSNNNSSSFDSFQLLMINSSYLYLNNFYFNTQSNLTTDYFIFNPNITTNCIQFRLADSLGYLTNTCFSINYTLEFTTRYLISESNKLYSNIISNDTWVITVTNNNCFDVKFTNYIVMNNKNYTNITTENQVYIKLDTNTSIAQFTVPIVIKDNSSYDYNLQYNISINDRLSQYLLNNYTSVTINNKQNNSIIFSLVGLDRFPYRTLNFNLTIYRSSNGSFSVSETDKLKNSQTLSFYLILKSVNSSNSCGVLTLNKYLSKLYTVNSQRSLYLIFDGDQSNSSCIVNLNYTISLYNSTKLINSFIDPISDNYLFVFTPIMNSIKEIRILDTAYVDENDIFLIKIDSVVEVTNRFLQPLFNSIDDTELILKPTPNVANGDAHLKSDLVVQYADFYSQTAFLYSLRNKFYRNVNYSKAEANYQLYFVNSTNNDTLIQKNNTYYPINLILNNSESQKISTVHFENMTSNIQSLIYNDLVLFGKVCFYSSMNILLNCTKINNLMYVEPFGIFQFANDLTIGNNNNISLNGYTESTFSINFVIERIFGSKESVDVFYTIVSTNSLTDLYLLPNYTNFITFNSHEVRKQLTIQLNNVYSSIQRDFYVILTKTQLANCNCSIFPINHAPNVFSLSSKIDKKNGIARVRLIPPIKGANIIAFSTNFQVISITSTANYSDVVLPVYRVYSFDYNLSQVLSCSLMTVGYNDNIPNFIMDSQYNLPLTSATLAIPYKDYLLLNQTVEFKATEIRKNITIRLWNTYFADDSLNNVEEVKVFYVYLSQPQNGASLIDPDGNTIFSPYVKVELHKMLTNSSTIGINSLVTGFMKLNGTCDREINYSDILNSGFIYEYQLESDKVLTGTLFNMYQIKWIAELVSSNGNIPQENITILDLVDCSFYKIDRPLFIPSVTKCINLINCNASVKTCSMKIKFKNTDLLNNNYTLKFQISSVNDAYNSNYLNVSISKNRNTSYLNIFSNKQSLTTVKFTKASLFIVEDKMRSYVELNVERVGLINMTTLVDYQTYEFSSVIWFYFNDLLIYSADSVFDFEPVATTLRFEPFETNKTIKINLRAAGLINSYYQSGLSPISPLIYNSNPNLYPRMFQVILMSCTPNCGIQQSQSQSNVTIVLESVRLWKVFGQSINEEPEINLSEVEVRSQMTLPTLSVIEMDIISLILKKLIYRIAVETSKINSTQDFNKLSDTHFILMGILCNLMNPSRTDTFGRIDLLALLEELIYLKLSYNPECSANSSDTLKGIKFTCMNTYFVYSVARYPITNTSIVSYEGIYYKAKIPQIIRPIPSQTSCVDVCVIEVTSTNWLLKMNVGSKKNPILNKKALSISTRYIRENNNEELKYNIINYEDREPVTIQLLQPRAIQTKRSCSILDVDSMDWNSQVCTTQKYSKYIECNCNHRSVYGIVYEKDESYYGYNYIWFYVSTGLKIIAMLCAVLSYYTCLNYLTSNSSCLAHLFCSIAGAQLLYLITVAISPSIIADEPLDKNSSCIAISIFFHYFLLSQFSWIFATALSLYMALSHNRKNTYYLKLMIVSIGWLSPIIVIAIFYLITGLIFEYRYDYSAAFIYSDVLDNQNICFIKNYWALLGGLILPWLMYLILTLVLIVLIFSNFKSWGIYDDIYRGYKNSKEILWIIYLWILVVIVNIWTILHMRLGQLWLFIIFCIFDFILSIYVTVTFTFVRHIFRSVRKRPVKTPPIINNDISAITRAFEFNNNAFTPEVQTNFGVNRKEDTIDGPVTKNENIELDDLRIVSNMNTKEMPIDVEHHFLINSENNSINESKISDTNDNEETNDEDINSLDIKIIQPNAKMSHDNNNNNNKNIIVIRNSYV